MNMLYYECFKAWFSDFEVLDVCRRFLEKIANSLVCNMWKVDKRFFEHNLSSCYQNGTCEGYFERSQHQKCFFVLDPWSSAPVAYSSIRSKSQIFNIEHDYGLWMRNLMVMMKKPENLVFETWPNSIRPKSQNSNIRDDLSIIYRLEISCWLFFTFSAAR
jgi:hypothetical protein